LSVQGGAGGTSKIGILAVFNFLLFPSVLMEAQEGKETDELTCDCIENVIRKMYASENSNPNKVENFEMPPLKRKHQNQIYPYEKWEEIVKFCDDHPSYTFKTIKKLYKKIPNSDKLSKMKKIVHEGGLQWHKLERIDIYVWKKFCHTRIIERRPVDDRTLKQWASEASQNFTFDQHQWLREFKSNQEIVSRKVTKIVSLKSLDKIEETKESASSFIKRIREMIEINKYDMVLNSDQMGVNKEMSRKRSHEFKGQKHVLISVRSINNTKHSYTLQPTITLDGKLCKKIFLILHEPTGLPKIKELFEASNVVVTSSRNGKTTTGCHKYWIDRCLKDIVSDKNCLLLLDSCSTHVNIEQYQKIAQNLTLEIIPAGTTGDIQPLDVYFNGPWKKLLRRIEEKDAYHGLRDNIIKLTSLVHNQMSSPKFEELIKYAFYASGYSENKPQNFETPEKICFPGPMTCKCYIDNCDFTAFMKCAICDNFICFYCFFVRYHFHDMENNCKLTSMCKNIS
jgi:hypothetical protein